MVDRAQAFTLEGIAASLLLLVTTYAVFQTSVAITPSWGELEDVQLKLLGYDLLRCADAELSTAISNIDKTTDCTTDRRQCQIDTAFSNKFNLTLNELDLSCTLEVLWMGEKMILNTTLLKPFDSTPPKNSIIVDRIIIINPSSNHPFCKSECAVEVRMILWRI